MVTLEELMKRPLTKIRPLTPAQWQMCREEDARRRMQAEYEKRVIKYPPSVRKKENGMGFMKVDTEAIKNKIKEAMAVVWGERVSDPGLKHPFVLLMRETLKARDFGCKCGMIAELLEPLVSKVAGEPVSLTDPVDDLKAPFPWSAVRLREDVDGGHQSGDVVIICGTGVSGINIHKLKGVKPSSPCAKGSKTQYLTQEDVDHIFDGLEDDRIETVAKWLEGNDNK
jgi:hypothetical protein